MKTIALLMICALPIAGCQGSFGLAELGRIRIGETTRAELSSALGPPIASLASFDVFRSRALGVSPPLPFTLLTWPIFFQRSEEELLFSVRYEAGIVAEAALGLSGEGRAFVLLLFQPHGPGVDLGPERLALLRAIDSRGIAVTIQREPLGAAHAKPRSSR